MRNKKGFTLIEVLLIIAVLGFFGVAAITSYLNVSKRFTFLSRYKEVMTTIRTARSYAVTNKGSNEADRYGVELDKNSITLFLDSGDVSYQFDKFDEVLTDKSYDFSDTTYTLELNGRWLPTPFYLFYEMGTGELSVYYELGAGEYILIPKSSQFKSLIFKFYDGVNDYEKYIYVFQVSGLAEEFDELPYL